MISWHLRLTSRSAQVQRFLASWTSTAPIVGIHTQMASMMVPLSHIVEIKKCCLQLPPSIDCLQTFAPHAIGNRTNCYSTTTKPADDQKDPSFLNTTREVALDVSDDVENAGLKAVTLSSSSDDDDDDDEYADETADEDADEEDDWKDGFNEWDNDEDEDEDEEDKKGPISPLEAQLQGVPRRLRRFIIQKMLKMKPTEAQSMSQFRKQFQMRVVDINRTCKVTKGGGILGFTSFVVCGNGNGAVGFGKGKAADVAASVDKAYSRSIRNLHYFERFEARTISHPVMAKYEKTKVYMWPGRPGSGVVAGGTVGGILRLAGFKDVKTKVIGSRHPHNTVKATFKALSMVMEETVRVESS